MRRVIFSVFALLLPLFGAAQETLSKSDKFSEHIYIYRLNAVQMHSIFVKGDAISEGYLTDYVQRYKSDEERPKLERGNYVLVQAMDNRLVFNSYVEDDMLYNFISKERTVLFLSDKQGRTIADAQVKLAGKRMKYDSKTQTYSAKASKKEVVLEIGNKGVWHYIKMDKDRPRPYYGRSYVDKPTRKDFSDNYTGYVLFSKPKYRPEDTVRVKIMVTDLKGKALKKGVNLVMNNHYDAGDTLLTPLSPYRPGAYQYQFALNDGYKMTLDRPYSIRIDDQKHKGRTYISRAFLYEDYELKRTSFSATVDKEKYDKTEPVELTLKVTDENGMAQMDGEVEIVVRSSGVSKYFVKELFIPTEVWRHRVKMDEPGQKKIVLPDSIWVKGASVNYLVEATYLSSDNEKMVENAYFLRDINDYTMDFASTPQGITIREMKGGEATTSGAVLTAFSISGDVISEQQTALPTTVVPIGNVSYYTVKTDNVTQTYYVNSSGSKPVNYAFTRVDGGDALLEVSNPMGIPFWYTIYSNGGKKVVASEYTAQTTMSERHRKGGNLTAKVEYLYGGYLQSTTGQLNDVKNDMKVAVNMAQTVYPGQRVDVEVAVTDGKGMAIKGADLTAFAYTSKFEEWYSNHYARPMFADNMKIITPMPSDMKLTGVQARMSWDRWKKEMELEGIEYYKFLHTKPIYTHSEPARDGVTQIAPYVVVDGDVQSSYIVFVDNVPYYFKEAKHMQVYTFRVSPGKHSVRIRTFDRVVYADNVVVKEGHKTVVAIDGEKSDKANQIKVEKIDIKKLGVKLYDSELAYMENFMLSVQPNFGHFAFNKDKMKVDAPAYLKAGENIYYLNAPKYNELYSSYNSRRATLPIVAGPFPYRVETGLHVNNSHVANFEVEGGYTYTVTPKLLKMKSWGNKSALSRNVTEYKPKIDFCEQPITVRDIDSIHMEYRHYLLRNSMEYRRMWYRWVVDKEKKIVGGDCNLTLELGTMADGKTKIDPIIIRFYDDVDSLHYRYRGAERNFYNLPERKVTIHLLMDDYSHYEQVVDIRQGGRNYLKIDSITIVRDQAKAERKRESVNKYVFTYVPMLEDELYLKAKDAGVYDSLNGRDGVVTGVVIDVYRKAMAGVTVSVKGSLESTVTDSEGGFRLKAEADGRLVFSSLNYRKVEVELLKGYVYKVSMSLDYSNLNTYGVSNYGLDEVVTIGHGSSSRLRLTGAMASVRVRGTSNEPVMSTTEQSMVFVNKVTLHSSKVSAVAEESTDDASAGDGSVETGGIPPMIILNGLPYSGKLEDIDESTIVSYKKMAAKQAVDLYGEQARGGVIVIVTRNVEQTMDGGGMQLRRNFRDDAFWIPSLTTDNSGKAKFEVTYPDDITSWKTQFYAMEGRKYITFEDVNVRSFKALNAQLSLPRFAIEGDKLDAVGRLSNYMGDTVALVREVSVDGVSMAAQNVSLEQSYVDTIPVSVRSAGDGEKGDSVVVKYTIKKEDGFFDGEERSIPIYKQGTLETKGVFEVVRSGEERKFDFDPKLGKVTIHAEASSLDAFMRELKRVDNYPYMCNEQMASKLKAMILKRRTSAIFELPFKEDKKIRRTINDINKNKNGDGLWGWWNRDETTLWISKHVVEALLMAEKDGFDVGLNRRMLIDYLVLQINNADLTSNLTNHKRRATNKRNCNSMILMLKSMDAQVDYPQLMERMESVVDTLMYDKMLSMRARQAAGMKVEIDSLLSWSESSMLGGLNWGEKPKFIPLYRHVPYISNVNSTLLAYSILREEGGRESDMERIQNYFFEERKGGSWRNIYEATKIMESIMPDMLKAGEKYAEVSAQVNGKAVDKFPYTTTTDASTEVSVKKSGALPLFFTAYQQSWNRTPEAENKGFKVSTVFRESADTVSVLVAGKSSDLVVTVEVEADAEYVMIEVPIPAGCSYESKWQGFYRSESHREFYKNRVSIFSTRLLKGKHTFVISLLPRFTGMYHLNPARAELMYFPTFYGRDQMKEIVIE